MTESALWGFVGGVSIMTVTYVVFIMLFVGSGFFRIRFTGGNILRQWKGNMKRTRSFPKLFTILNSLSALYGVIMGFLFADSSVFSAEALSTGFFGSMLIALIVLYTPQKYFITEQGLLIRGTFPRFYPWHKIINYEIIKPQKVLRLQITGKNVNDDEIPLDDVDAVEKVISEIRMK